VEGKARTIEDLKINVPDPRSQIPLYYQIYSDLLRLINTKQLLPDDTIPPEMELTKLYQVSRQTLRGALKLLERERLIKRTAGKGTKVLASQNRIQFILNQSFAMQMRSLGLTPGSKVLKINHTTIDGNSNQIFKSKIGSEALELIRLRFNNDLPIGIQYTTIIIDKINDLETNDFNKESLYNLLLTKYHLPINQIDYVVSSVLADPWHQALLQIRENVPLLMVQTTAYLDNGSPIEVTTSYYIADKFEFTSTQKFSS